MIRFRAFLIEREVQSGQAAGTMELAQTPEKVAYEFADAQFQKHQNQSVEEAIPDFKKNFKVAKRIVALGRTKRHDMPVIEDYQVHDLQRKLKHGALDHEKPFAPETNEKNPFPEGLTGDAALNFNMRGFHDHKLTDDVVDSGLTTVQADKLVPIQKQIYLSKSLTSTAEFGVNGSTDFLKNSAIIVSGDNHIVDGHHRWSSALLIDPKMKMKALKIDMPIKKLVPLLRAYGDSIGNKRNA